MEPSPLAAARRLLVKVGSAVIAGEGGLDREKIAELAAQMAALIEENRQVVLVSSGAISAAGGFLPKPPSNLGELQAAAALGQPELMRSWQEAFARHGLRTAQVLLTADDLAERARYNNARGTLERLLTWGVVPVVNENDTVMTEEIQFGDNDQLAVLVASMIGADLLAVLSEADALYERDPREDPAASPIRKVAAVTPEVMAMASDRPGSAGRGGMKSKLIAAAKSAAAGIPLWLLPGREPQVLARALAGEEIGTIFTARERRYAGERLWLAQLPRSSGSIVVDTGAARALRHQGRSLLAVGVREVRGQWDAGSPVRVLDPEGGLVGMGLCNYSSDDLRRIAGAPSDRLPEILKRKVPEEVIHRNHFALARDP